MAEATNLMPTLVPVEHGAYMVLVGQAVPQVLQGRLLLSLHPQVGTTLLDVEMEAAAVVVQQDPTLAEWAVQAVPQEAEAGAEAHRPRELVAHLVQAQMAQLGSGHIK